MAVVAKGYGAGGIGASYAFIVQNPNADQAAENIRCQIAAYDKDGTVLTTTTNSIAVLFPSQKLGVGGSLSLQKGQQIDRLDVQVKPDKYETFKSQPTFSAENVKFIPGTYDSKVTGVVKSPYLKDINEVEVSAIAYDAAGKIIGGGHTYLNFVPAQGQAAVEVSLQSSGTPAKVELYPRFSNLSLLSS